ncbi:uncharacterized protein BDZ99DRAFT_501173 [Mytilinidion resinicola]|uniref:Uncharacterized protein n=1 Tax=Mytilinidion resinicola TaxID=574789 RepID=A0A6A6YEK0_9PEZI|nr:uncharacterized protein BDZ99DRAFT_501173 [Mytilinidion resinicola]KAF2806277.1 hypothetical protein BDZ99DRAFT_501173 [Mytilinidion resinicola]
MDTDQGRLSYDGLPHVPDSTLGHNPYSQPLQGQALRRPPGVYDLTYENRRQPQGQKARILDLQKPTLLILGGLLCILIIVGAVAGGMGAALAALNRKIADAQRSAVTAAFSTYRASATGTASSASSSTASGSTTAVPTASTTGTIIESSSLTIVRDCPSSNGSTTTISVSPEQRFVKHCSFLFDTHPSNAFGNYTTSFDACIGLCASYNVLTSPDAKKCNGVGWRWGSDPPWGAFWDVFWAGWVDGGFGEACGRIDYDYACG